MWDESDELKPHEVGAKQSTTTARETLSAAWDAGWRVENTLAETWNKNEAYKNHSDEVYRLTGEKLPTHPNRLVDNTFGHSRQVALKRYQANLENLAKKHEDNPMVRDFILKDLDEAALDIGASYQEKLHRTYDEAPSGIKTGAAMLLGQGGAMMLDPPNVGAMALSMGIGAVPNTARGLLTAAVKGALVNGMAEGLTMPQAAAYRDKIGDPMGQQERSWRIAGAVLGGFGLEAGGRGLWRYGRHLKGDEAITNAKGGVIAYKKKGGFSEEAAALTPQEMAEAAVNSATTESVIGRARDGDTKAAIELTQKLGIDSDPNIAALSKTLVDTEHLDAEKLAPDELKPQVRRAQEQARAHAEAPLDEPLPAPIQPIPKEKGPNLVDVHADPRRTKLPQESVPGVRYTDDATGKPYYAEDFSKSQGEIEVAPEIFQFKRGGDAQGVTDRLSGVEEWNAVDAGRIIVFEREGGLGSTVVDGHKRTIADGHQRLSLWRRLVDSGKTPEGLHGWVFREADGWTAMDVRAMAAKKNLKEGTGDAVDIAKVVKAHPNLVDAGVPMSGKPMEQGMALAKLTDAAFAKVEMGAIPERYAAVVGDFTPADRVHIQESLIDTLIEQKPTSVPEARQMVNQMLRAPEVFEQTADLFGVKNTARHLAVERGRILNQALAKMKSKAKLFRTLKAEAKKIEDAGNSLDRTGNAKALDEAATVGELVSRLAMREGRVSEFLDDAAAEMNQGGSMAKVVDDFVDNVSNQLDEGGMTSLMASTRPRNRVGVDDVEAEGPEIVEKLTKEFEFDEPKAKPTTKEGEAKAKTKAEGIEEKELAVKAERIALVNALKKEGIDTKSLDEGTRARQLSKILENCKL